MRRIARVTMLGLLALLCSAGSCQDKGAVVGSLLSHGGRLRKDPISEPMLYTRDFPGIHNPFAPAGIDTRLDIYARRNIALGDPLLYSHNLHAFGLGCYDDGRTGFTPTLIADQVWTIPSDGTFAIGLADWLTRRASRRARRTTYAVNCVGPARSILPARRHSRTQLRP